MKNNLELVRKLTELLEWQKEQEEQVKIAEQLSQKLKDQLKNEREILVETDDENLIDKSSLNNHLINVLENNLSNCEKSFDKNLLSDIIEESFEQGLSNEYQSKFSTPKEKLSIDSSNDEMNYTTDYKEKSFTKHCTEECLKSNCIHSLKFNESYESILNIISQYNSSKKHKDKTSDDDFYDENEKILRKKDKKTNEFYNSDVENDFDKTYLHFKEVYKEVISKNLEKPELSFKSSSEKNLSFEFPNKINKFHGKEPVDKNEFKNYNRTFSSETINLQLKDIEKDLGINDIENYPIKPGIDGCNVKTFDELLNQHLTNTSIDYMNKSENQTKKPFLRKGAGLKRFQLSNTNQPKGKLCKLKKNIENKKIEAEPTKKQFNKKRIDYLARPKRAISEKDVNTIEKIQTRAKRIIDNDLNFEETKKTLNKIERKNSKKENLVINLENKKDEPQLKKKENYLMKKENRKENYGSPVKKENKKEKLIQVQLVSKLSKDLSNHENYTKKNEYIQRDWDKKESEECSNRRVEALLEKIIEVCEAKTDSKKEEEIKIDLINFLKSLLKIENNSNYQSTQCKDCGKNFDFNDDSSFDNSLTKINSNKNDYSEKLLTKPGLGIQTIELRKKIENLHKRLNNLQTRCDLDEKKKIKKIDKNFTLQKQDCTCSNQINILKSKINFLNCKLKEIEQNTLSNGIDEKNNTNKNLEEDCLSMISSVESKIDYVCSKNQPVINLEKNNKITKYKNGLTLIEKENGTVEKVCSNGYKETFLNDGTIIRVLIDGTKIIDYPDGEREISTSIFKRRELVNGEVKTIYSDGTKETRYPDGRLRIKDKYGNIIADSKILAKNS